MVVVVVVPVADRGMLHPAHHLVVLLLVVVEVVVVRSVQTCQAGYWVDKLPLIVEHSH